MMASDMEKYVDMSLDEYIATRKAELRTIGNKAASAVATSSSTNSASSFKAERRNSKMNDEVEDELMNDLEPQAEQPHVNSNEKLDKSFGIWRGPTPETSYIDLDYMRDEFDEMFNDPELKKSNEEKQVPKQDNQQRDLRERLNNNSISTNNSSNVKKQQEQNVQLAENKQNRNTNVKRWSNMQNQQQSMSLTSLNTDGGLSNGQYRRRWNNNRNFRRRNNNDGCGNRGNNFVYNGGQNMNAYNNRNGGIGCMVGVNNTNILPMNYNNGRIQRTNQRYNQDVVNKNIKAVLEQINSTNSIYANRQRSSSVRDLTIECPSVVLPGRISAGSVHTAAAAAAAAAAAQPNLQPTQTQNDLKALLGVNESNLKTETMAMWAGKLLDLFQSSQQQTVHKPIYDMHIQKEIHELQGKSLLYKCPGGEVVSSDGTGIDNCKITPSSSGVTLNYRFG